MEIVNVCWLCKILTKRFHEKYFVSVARNAVYSVYNGWLCDCGKWTTGDDVFHVPIEKAQREIFEE